MKEIINLKEQLNKWREETPENNLSDLEVLRKQKSKGHSRTNPAAQPQLKTPQELHTCKVCKAISDTNENFENHMKLHTVSCEKCTFRTDTNQEMTKHIELNHKVSTPTKCSFCPATFVDQKNIFAHRKQHYASYQPCRNIQDCTLKDLF